MKIQKQPNRWSCLPTAFAIALDVDVNLFIKHIGHDGSEFIWPEMPEPMRRRAFHIQECLDIAMKLGFAPVQVEANPISTANINQRLKLAKQKLSDGIKNVALPLTELKEIYDILNGIDGDYYYTVFKEGNENRLSRYMNEYRGVLLGETLSGKAHAVAWNCVDQKIYDPSLPDPTSVDEFLIETFYALVWYE
jgi:hypothetical protein